LLRIKPYPDVRAFFALAILGFLWLLANLGDVKVFQQFTLVAMIPTLVWAILGWNVVKEISFPLVFLFFSVPFGEFLLPSLINFTADFTVSMLKLTQIPVYREGTYFSIPSGEWSVVEACSGLRYLIASITLGCLFAYFNYRSLLRRVCFITVSSLVPIVANGFRAYMIVMIAHLSNMKLALGVDHFIYGWIFFGIVMTVLFWIGSWWSEELDHVPQVDSEPDDGKLKGLNEYKFYMFTGLALAISSIWPLRAEYIDNHINALTVNQLSVNLPDTVGMWKSTDPITDWKPSYVGASTEIERHYSDGQDRAAIFIKYYGRQQQDKELINSQNKLIAEKSAMKLISETPYPAIISDEKLTILQGIIKSDQQELLTWRWYWISGKITSNQYFAKILHALTKLTGDPPKEVAIILAMEMQNNDIKQSARTMQNFAQQLSPYIVQSLSEPTK
jgi:exosortase A